MASETHDAPQTASEDTPNEQLLTWLSVLGGGGIVLAMIAAGIGVINPDIDSAVIGLLVLSGFAMLIMGVGGWAIVVQPHKNFDDINQPLYTGHHDVEDTPIQEETYDADSEKVLDEELLDSPGEVDVSEPEPIDQEVEPDAKTNPEA